MAADWPSFIETQSNLPYLKDTLSTIDAKRQQGVVIHPNDEDVFAAFSHTPLENTKVVILGQDPYHGPGQAHGLSFSVQPGVKHPPSLRNIFKELTHQYPDFQTPDHGSLIGWAKQGVLLLNTVLTVESGQAHSHKHLGWETFTERALMHINAHCEQVVFLLWGNHAIKKGQCIDTDTHCVLTSAHPSPLSARRGFFGNQHFIKANEYLSAQGKTPIDWQQCHF